MFDIKVEYIDSHIRIKLPKINHRNNNYVHRLIYEETLIRILSEYRKRVNHRPIEYSSIIYEHISYDSKLRDNDNYNLSECKQILDAMVCSGLITTDNGAKCEITHITSLSNDMEEYTFLHIINIQDDFNYEIERNIKKASLQNNKTLLNAL